MAVSITGNYLKNLVVRIVVGKTGAGTSYPNGTWIALSYEVPNASGSNIIEPAAAQNYERVHIGGSVSSSYGVGVDMTVDGSTATNNEEIKFNHATADYLDTVKAIAIYDAKTGGNFLGGCSLDTPLTVRDGMIVYIAKNGLTITVA